jgi:ribosomal protein S18 acetylase RimI-like enzyme
LHPLPRRCPAFQLNSTFNVPVEGFVTLCRYRDDDLRGQNVGEISSIYINPSLLGTGLSAMLFSKGLVYLSKAGYKTVALWVLEQNSVAIGFYEKFGFHADGSVKVHPKTGLKEFRYVSEATSS